jgi:hypothetical protein
VTLPVFLSFPKPGNPEQQALVDGICAALEDRGLVPRTLGVSEYDMEVPLRTVRRMLLESNGLIAIGLRRYQIENGVIRRGQESMALRDAWFTSPWPHIETAMAYQIGLPIFALRESGVHTDGVFDKGTFDVYIPEVDTSKTAEFLKSQQWRQTVASWERDVRMVAKNRGTPPKLY